VVVATKAYSYHSGIDETNGFRVRPQVWEAPHELDQLAHHLARTGVLTGSLRHGADGGRPQVQFRAIAAGEVVLNSRNTRCPAAASEL